MLTSAGLEGNLHKLELLNRLDLKTEPCQRFRDHLHIARSSNNIEIENKKNNPLHIMQDCKKWEIFLTNHLHIARLSKKLLQM